ncbi:type VI secretion system tip protein TssI/VgrG [Endozoicomonas gorgoniicola]|uniref:Type VI secretion system tip protein TssI/VgrG n=1 Tax=Endozoicomonas gorgoniicola TaxID=1234144 RepID=A0ABT3MP35_9GAMM|nr:type VI secretion system tip protein TssI/VgrG [Endozoicomonas gorgoniicola]MCW7551137.1 type VI secretion system tip protein TssI/VgrG [Endozoicomonas gorgoniicola]
MAEQTIDPESRPLVATTEDGNKLIVARLTSTERLDDLYEHRALVLVRDVDERTLLGQTISFCYQPLHGSERRRERFFHGFCVEVRQVGWLSSRDYLQYEVVAAPWSWFLSQRINCRVFQQQKTSEIIAAIAREHGFQSYLELNGSNDQRREYCVQFNETDWGFIQRLINAQGWYYFFRQQEEKHTLVIGENNRLFGDCGESGVEYFVGSHKLKRAITEWQHVYSIGAGSVVTADYNVEMAEPVMADEVKTTFTSIRHKNLQQYFYPGGFQEKNTGNTISAQQMQGIDTGFSEVSGASCRFHFASGTTFHLDHHPESEEQVTWLLSEVVHTFNTAEDGHSIEYTNRFRCLPVDTPWKARQRLPKPVMAGLQSASVTGPDNEEIYLDKYHRIKLQFHWDREGKSDQNSSCWVRVAQSLAGNGFGCQFTPRVGDEVLVGFLDSDPDQPLVVGTVYNGKRQQPYSNSMEQGMRLKSLPGAGADHFSELRFNCKSEEELVYLQAQKDMKVLVKNDAERTVTGNDKTLVEKASERTVKENDTHKVEGEQSTEVIKNLTTKTDADYQLQTKGKYQQQTDGSFDLKVGESTTVNSQGSLELETKGNMTGTASGSLSLDAASISGKGKTDVELTVGASKVSLSPSAVEISCGPSTVKVSPAGVEISGIEVKANAQVMAEIKGGVSASLEGSVNAEVKGTLVTINGNALTTVKAGALVELSGAIAKIN